MSTFALIHGAWHRAAHWDDLVTELRARGHRAVAVDLPAEDEQADFSAYARQVVDEIEGEDDVVVVAHSLMGSAGALVAAARPVRRLVYLTAILPALGQNLMQRFGADEPILLARSMSGVEITDDVSHWTDAGAAIERMYADVDDARARKAVELLRGQSRTPHRETFPLDELPAVPVTSIVCAEDRIMDNEWLRTASRDRFGVECVELPGSHSPMLSRPAALADVLVAP